MYKYTIGNISSNFYSVFYTRYNIEDVLEAMHCRLFLGIRIRRNKKRCIDTILINLFFNTLIKYIFIYLQIILRRYLSIAILITRESN